MKKLLFLLCAWSGVAMAKTVVIETNIPNAWPVPPVKIVQAPAGKALEGGEDVAKGVRQFLDGKHSAQEKIDVLTWWAEQVKRADVYIDLASRCAALGHNELAFHWLQRAAREDSCDLSDFENKADFLALLKDTRWPVVKEDLMSCAALWQVSSFYRHVLTIPNGYDGKLPIPLVIGLHGFGSLPEDFSGADHQRMSDALGIAFLSVSGRLPLGRNSFMWSDDFQRDWQHIEAAIARARSDVNPAPGKMVAIGFSQGGQLAAEIAAAFPQQFRGCVSLSPGSRFASGLVERLEKTPTSLAGQQYFFSWISGEGTGPKQRVQTWRPVLEKQKATVYQYEFPGKGHNFPRNYEDYFSISLQVILRK